MFFNRVLCVSLVLFGFCSASLRFTGQESAAEIRHTLKGVSLVSLRVVSEEHVRVVKAALAFNNFLGEFSEPRVGNVEILCETHRLEFFQNLGMEWDLMVEDMSRLLEERSKKDIDSEDWFEEYHTLDYIDAKLDEMVALHPDIATKVLIGLSWEGRAINAIRISGPNPSKAIVYHGGIHAREWIGPAVVQFIYNELLRGYGNNPLVTELVNEIEWTIVPVLNVDGYVYAHDVNPAWRKTRKPNEGSECIGTDPNRNWQYMWSVGGSSDDPCSNSFAGSVPFDNPEPRSIDLYVRARQSAGMNVLAYSDFHCCGNLWMTPYAYVRPEDRLPENNAQLQAVGQQIADAIQSVHGQSFLVGNIGDPRIIGLASGSSVDHVHSQLGVPLSYGIELRANSQFDPSVIIPSGEEMWAGILVYGQSVLQM